MTWLMQTLNAAASSPASGAHDRIIWVKIWVAPSLQLCNLEHTEHWTNRNIDLQTSSVNFSSSWHLPDPGLSTAFYPFLVYKVASLQQLSRTLVWDHPDTPMPPSSIPAKPYQVSKVAKFRGHLCVEPGSLGSQWYQHLCADPRKANA